MHISTKFGQRVRDCRASRGLSQRDVVAASDGVLSQATLARLERGEVHPNLSQLMAIAWALGLTVDELIEETPLSERVLVAARGDNADINEAITTLLPYLQLRLMLDTVNAS